MIPGLRHADVVVNGFRLHVAEAGPADGPLVVLLHGFPETWAGWRAQIGPLAEAGFRVVAPDQRGYGESDKPKGVAAYGADRLAADVAALIAAAGAERASVVGHDWGGIVAFWVALRHPERVDRLAILNAPHPAVFWPYLRRHPRQWLRSAYVALFQLPGLPEWLLGRDGARPLADALRRNSRPGAFPDALLDEYRRAWSAPGALTAMLNWYRAVFRYPSPAPPSPRIGVPTLILWGARDAALGAGIADANLALCDDGRLDLFPDATHWIAHEEPDAVNRRLIAFLDPAPTR
jgi:pimeloyl-ACP methyl ester carboxylesterase